MTAEKDEQVKLVLKNFPIFLQTSDYFIAYSVTILVRMLQYYLDKTEGKDSCPFWSPLYFLYSNTYFLWYLYGLNFAIPLAGVLLPIFNLP